MLQAPNGDISEQREKLKQAVRTLAELAKESSHNIPEGDMVDIVVEAGAVEAIVPLLFLSQQLGEEGGSG